MANKYLAIEEFHGGIAHAEKQGTPGSFFFGKRLDIYGDPGQMTILPKTAKESASIVTGLIKWMIPGTPHDTKLYAYDEDGCIYERASNGTWTKLRTVANSVGQGLGIFDDYLYYVQNTQIGRYGPLSGGAPTFTDNWQTGLNDTSTSGYAPVLAFAGGIAFGHGNDVAWWDGSTFDVDKLVLPIGINCRSMTRVDEFLAIGCWRGTSITSSEDGFTFLWDGTSQSYNLDYALEEGAINALHNSKNRVMTFAGSSGFLYLNYSPFQKVQQLPKLTGKKYVEVCPGAMTNWRGLTHMGVAVNTDSTAIIQGVYQWGSRSENFPEVLNYGFTISTGTETGTTLKIGAVRGVGADLFIAWEDNGAFGVDKVSKSSDPYATAIYEALIFNDRRPGEGKQAKTIKAIHLPLASGESVQLGYKSDRATSYTTGDANSTVGSVETRLPVDGDKARFFDFQVECILATSGSTAPVITSITVEYEDLEKEKVF